MRTKRLPLWLAFCWCLFLLAGCAGRQPKTLELGAAEEQAAQRLWSGFLAIKRPAALDADLRVGWDTLASKGTVSASVQLQNGPSRLRFTATDPLGRSLLIAVADARSFTLVDNRIGHVYQGAIDSVFWHSRVPASIAPEDLLSYLGGFLPEGEGLLAVPSEDENRLGFWYQWRDAHGLRHHILLDRTSGEMRRHLVFAEGEELLLDLDYAEQRRDQASGIMWPGRLRLTGKALSGTVTVEVTSLFSHTPKGAAAFRLSPPPHFTLEQVL